MTQFFSEAEKAYIKKCLNEKGQCILDSDKIVGLVILKGKNYNKEFIGYYTDKEIVDEWDESEREQIKIDSDYVKPNTVDEDHFVWLFDQSLHQELQKKKGEMYSSENQEPNICMDNLDDLLLFIEKYYGENKEFFKRKIDQLQN